MKNKKVSKYYSRDRVVEKISAKKNPRSSRPRLQATITKAWFGKKSDRADLDYWLSRPPSERIEAVEFLRKKHYGSSTRLQRTVQVIKSAQHATEKRAAGRKKDLADLEAMGEE